MKRREDPAPAGPPPVDRDRVRELVARLHAAYCGESVPAAGPGYSLEDFCGGSCMLGYYLAAEFGHPDPAAVPSIDSMVDNIVKCAAGWAEGTDRVRHPSRYS